MLEHRKLENLQPYAHCGGMPDIYRRPSQLGAPTRVEYYRAKETAIPGDGAISDGAQFEFTANAVITGFQMKTNLTQPADWDLGVQVVKDGRQHLFTDGREPLRVSPASIASGHDPWCRVWIPVDQGEIWKFDCQNNQVETTADYSLILRVERFMEPPKVIPAYITETTFYQLGEDDMEAGASSGAGMEFDFLRDGILSGLRAATNTSIVVHEILSGVELDITMEGQLHLSMARQTQSPIDCHELSTTSQPWEPMWYAVSQHEKWQCFARNTAAVQKSFRLTAKVEELRLPWLRW